MATAVKMPQLGMTMTEAKITRWLKREGDLVQKGEPIAEIETDKLNSEVEASAGGVLRRIVAPEGAVVPVVGIMAVIGGADEPESAVDAAAGAAAAPAPRGPAVSFDAGAGGQRAAPAPRGAAPTAEIARAVKESAPMPREATGSLAIAAAGSAMSGEVRASPIARRLAADLSVDLSRIQGTGPGGRIVEADVRAAATTAVAPRSPAEREPGGVAAPTDGFVRASPIARRLAREHGLDLRQVRGSGPDGRVIERDVLAAVESRAAAPAWPAPAVAPSLMTVSGLTPRETIKLDGMRRVIAERLHQSLLQAAQLTLTTEADATALVELRGHLVPAAKVYGHRPPSYTDLLVAIVARVLRDHPLLNSSLVGEGDARTVVCWQEINVGVAVALDRGLIVPVIRNADQKPLQTISQELGDLAERARASRLTMDDLQGGTFTITNLGQVEVDGFTPILNPPQCAILGAGRIARKPAVYQDQVTIRHLVTLSLTFDHRIVDGYPAGAFLRDVKRAVEAAAIGQ